MKYNKQKDYQRKYNTKFDGSYIYYIIERPTQKIVYIGETSNIVARYSNHMSDGYRVSTSAFHNWIIEHRKDKSNYDVVVLDLTRYKELDADDRRIIEKALQLIHKQHLISDRNRSPMNAYEIDRFEQLSTMIDFDFKPYTQIKVEKLQQKKGLLASNK